MYALAVLAASGASFAQSSVTVYGTVDVALANVAVTGSPTQNLMASSGVSSSNFGFKGSEDLGGGLKANFKLEQGFDVDTGAAHVAGAAFSRYAYVGVSGGFGEVQLGKNGTPYDDIQNATDAAFASNALSPIGGAAGAFRSSQNYNWTVANTIKYVAPAMGGFNAEVSYSLGENKADAVVANPLATPPVLAAAAHDAGSLVSLNATYATGPMFVGFAYQAEKANGNVDSVNYTRLNASYDLKVATLLGSYGKVSNNGGAVYGGTGGTYVSGASTNEWSLGANFPVGKALTLSAGYAASTDDANTLTATEVKRTVYSLAGAYSLSKRTTAYAGYTSGTSTPTGGVDTTVSAAAGIKHTF